MGIAAYLIFGSWLNWQRHSARGWDLVPHSETLRGKHSYLIHKNTLIAHHNMELLFCLHMSRTYVGLFSVHDADSETLQTYLISFEIGRVGLLILSKEGAHGADILPFNWTYGAKLRASLLFLLIFIFIQWLHRAHMLPLETHIRCTKS